MNQPLQTERYLFLAGSLNMLLIIILGALASHALKPQMNIEQQGYWQTALFYHSLHAFTLFLLGFLAQKQPGLVKIWQKLAILNGLGILFFSGGLYVLAMGFQSLHFLIPIGGFIWMIHWGWLSWIWIKPPRLP
ncbi:DUF423 domain-containing protein [Thiosulfativibrio zosterae]|uniref:DUF423 domain-containing protein n=1 Tax=Thiosulfativibrio zosterae TaxID=2675053 RepID=A0A6F8PM07_9GAMM|nr:DUF423 domain-containing protein [Thiosulfativibrio zosterae]BBP43030.1 DUF423 domain-containing protein [Thiosulfativibrio zosterae]